MNVVARTMAWIAGLCGGVFALAGLVRAAALGGDEGAVWNLPRWWTELVDGPETWVLTLVAVAVAAGAALYLIVAFRQLQPPGPPATARVGDADVKMAALERLVSQRLAAEIAGLKPVRVKVSWADEGWDAHALVDLPPLDLAGVTSNAVAVTGAELLRATGSDLGRLSLEVHRFVGRDA
jgi:hypothetical protein